MINFMALGIGRQRPFRLVVSSIPFPLLTDENSKEMKQNCPCGNEWDVMAAPLQGRYCRACGEFDEARFMASWHPPYFVVFSFIHRFMRRNLAQSGMDYLTNKIASEIWLYNFGQTLQDTEYQQIAHLLGDETSRHETLKKCNTHSLAQYLGIPHQTARRKVQALIERGWVVRSPEGLLSISAACEEEFKPEFILETFRDFISTARATMAVMGLDK